MRGVVFKAYQLCIQANIAFTTQYLPMSMNLLLVTGYLSRVQAQSSKRSSGFLLALSWRSLLPVCRYLEVVSMLS